MGVSKFLRHSLTEFKTDMVRRFTDMMSVLVSGVMPSGTGQEKPILPDVRERVLSPQTSYQIVSMLEGVVKRGTGRSIRSVGKPLAGENRHH